MILEQGDGPKLLAANGQSWRCVSDQVMGGVSAGTLERCTLADENALRLTGSVRLDNNGGFLQMSLALAEPGSVLDASSYAGFRLRMRGNHTSYNMHLRSADMSAVWQSWRAEFIATPDWRDVTLPFSKFRPHRTDLPVNPARLTRLGLVAIGREMQADLALARLELIRA